MSDIIEEFLPSDCYSEHDYKSIDGIVIHFISAKNILPHDPFNTDAIFNIFKQYKVSANYLIKRDGTIIKLTPDHHKAWHAGKSIMNGREDCNDFTIGIELEGGTNWPFEDEQILNLGMLCGQLMTKNNITLDWVQGHDHIRENWLKKYPNWNREHPDKPISKKVDPGEHFPWEVLSDMLYGVSEGVCRGVSNND